jgi:hypothetical protein
MCRFWGVAAQLAAASPTGVLALPQQFTEQFTEQCGDDKKDHIACAHNGTHVLNRRRGDAQFMPQQPHCPHLCGKICV